MAPATPILDLDQPRDRRIDELLHKTIIIWFSTLRPDGRPHLVPVWFLWEDSAIYIFSKPDVKVANLRHDKRVSLGIANERGGDVVLLEGEATLLDPSEISTAHAPYAEKYADLLNSYGWTGESMSKEYSQPIRVEITRILGR
jgi:PPOX class probable F420-dependent enzyme